MNTRQSFTVCTTVSSISSIFISFISFIIFIMLRWTSLLVFVLCSAVTPVLCCDWLRRYGHLSEKSLDLIRQMGGELTEEESPVPFPNQLYKCKDVAEVSSQLVFIRDSLEEISRLYRHDNLSSVSWDANKTREFQTIIDRQKDEISSCVSTVGSADRSLRRYYRRLSRRILTRTGGGPVYWELIRRETKRHLERLHMLVTSMRGRSAPTRH